MTAPTNATHWTPASPASSRRVYSLDRPGGAHDDTLDPHDLPEQLRGDEAIAEADTLLLTVPNQLGVDYNAHVIESILTHVAPALGWR